MPHSNEYLQKVIFHQDAVFHDASVKAAITLFNNTRSFSQVEKTVVYEDGHSKTSELDWYYRDVVIDETKYKVLKIFEDKIACEDNMSIVIPGRGPFGLNFMSKCFVCNKSKFSTHKTDFYDTPVLIGAEQLKYYINTQDNLDYTSDGILSEVKLNLEHINDYKMAFPKAGIMVDKQLPTYILEPGEIYIDKFLSIFTKTKQEAENAEKYFNSKFYRAGLASKMTSWISVRPWHSNVPIQDFTNNSDIDWSGDIDKQLYKKYNLTDEEISLIETYIK